MESSILAIELSQRSGGVAIVSPKGHVEEIEVAGGRRESDDLAPAVAQVLERCGLGFKNLAGIAVDVGPGGFTGLRISLSLVQAIAEVHALPVHAVPAALVAIASTPGIERSVGVVDVCLAAKRESVWRTRFTRQEPTECWRAMARGGLVEEAGDLSDVGVMLGDEHLGSELRDAYVQADVDIVTPHVGAATVGRLALEQHPDVVRPTDPAQLLPIYPREPEAVRVWRDKTPR